MQAGAPHKCAPSLVKRLHLQIRVKSSTSTIPEAATAAVSYLQHVGCVVNDGVNLSPDAYITQGHHHGPAGSLTSGALSKQVSKLHKKTAQHSKHSGKRTMCRSCMPQSPRKDPAYKHYILPQAQAASLTPAANTHIETGHRLVLNHAGPAEAHL